MSVISSPENTLILGIHWRPFRAIECRGKVFVVRQCSYDPAQVGIERGSSASNKTLSLLLDQTLTLSDMLYTDLVNNINCTHYLPEWVWRVCIC